jgi:outer membrane protein assembly factor BamB
MALRQRVYLSVLFSLVGMTFVTPEVQATETCPAHIDANFTCLVTYRGIGAVLASLVGPGPIPGSERLFQSHIYGNTLDIVAVDPDSGEYQVFPGPVRGENGAWALAWGPDGNLYIGTLPHAHLFQLNPRTGVMTDLGRPSDSEEYIWRLTVAADGKLYGSTYPSAKLVRFDPATGRSEDLGSMDPDEQYALSIAASDDGYVYVGIGYGKTHLIAYEIASGHHRDILPVQDEGTGVVSVHRYSDERIYAGVGGKYFRVHGWELHTVDPALVPSLPETNRLRDGRLVVKAEEGIVRVRDPNTKMTTEHPFLYAGKELGIFRLGMGPDGMLYGSGYMPAHLFRADPATGSLEDLGIVGDGEIYNFLPQKNSLLGAAYVGMSPLMIYHPSRPFAPGIDAQANPLMVQVPEGFISWRPMAMINGPDGKVYLGAQAEYGKLGGPLVMWDLTTNQVESYDHLVTDQSVTSLTTAHGQIIGGTTIHGGGGSHETQTQATLFIWDPTIRRRVFDTPVSASSITDLIAATEDRIYGFADGTLFVFERSRRELMMTTASIPGLIYNSVTLGQDGWVWGLSADGIFAIDPVSGFATPIARAPEPITAGFAVQWPYLYYASGARIYRYTFPSAVGQRQ